MIIARKIFFPEFWEHVLPLRERGASHLLLLSTTEHDTPATHATSIVGQFLYQRVNRRRQKAVRTNGSMKMRWGDESDADAAMDARGR